MNRNKIEERSSEHNESVQSSFYMPRIFSKDISYGAGGGNTRKPAKERLTQDRSNSEA